MSHVSPAARTALMVAYYFPPSASVGTQRTLRWVRYLPELGWCPVLLTVRERDYGNTPLVPQGSRVEPRVPVYRARVARPLEWALAVRALGRTLRRTLWRTLSSSRVAARTAQAALAPAAAATSAHRSAAARWFDPWVTTPDANLGWWPFAVVAGLRAVWQQRPDVLYTSGPPHSSHLIAIVLKKLTGLPWVADFRDPWSRRPWLAAADRQGRRYRIQVRLEALVINQADCVVLNTETMGADFRKAYPEAAAKFRVISNGYDPEAFGMLPDVAPPTEVFTLTHAGALYRRRDPRPLLRAVATLRDRHVIDAATFRLNLVGSAEPQFELDRLIEQQGLAGLVTLVPRVPHAESLAFLARSHVLVIIQPDTELQVPGKLFEYLYLRKPVLALTGEGATADIVRRYELGVVADPADVDSIAASLEQAYREFKAGRVPGVGRVDSALRVFHGRVLARQLADAFEEVTHR